MSPRMSAGGEIAPPWSPCPSTAVSADGGGPASASNRWGRQSGRLLCLGEGVFSGGGFCGGSSQRIWIFLEAVRRLFSLNLRMGWISLRPVRSWALSSARPLWDRDPSALGVGTDSAHAAMGMYCMLTRFTFRLESLPETDDAPRMPERGSRRSGNGPRLGRCASRRK